MSCRAACQSVPSHWGRQHPPVEMKISAPPCLSGPGHVECVFLLFPCEVAVSWESAKPAGLLKANNTRRVLVLMKSWVILLSKFWSLCYASKAVSWLRKVTQNNGRENKNYRKWEMLCYCSFNLTPRTLIKFGQWKGISKWICWCKQF